MQTASRCWSQASCSTACPWCWRSARLARVSAPPSARWCPLPRCPPSPEPQCPHCPGSAGPWPPRRWWRRCCAGAARRSWPRPPPGACCGWRGRWTACRASCGCWVRSQRHNNVTSRHALSRRPQRTTPRATGRAWPRTTTRASWSGCWWPRRRGAGRGTPPWVSDQAVNDISRRPRLNNQSRAAAKLRAFSRLHHGGREFPCLKQFVFLFPEDPATFDPDTRLQVGEEDI